MSTSPTIPDQHSRAGKGSGTTAAGLPELCFCWSCFFCRRRAGAAVISYLVKKAGFARTSYFQQSTQDCFAVAVRGYSCISSLLLMETALQGCFPHGKEQNGGQPACRFTSYSRTLYAREPASQPFSDVSGRDRSY